MLQHTGILKQPTLCFFLQGTFDNDVSEKTSLDPTSNVRNASFI